MDDVEGDSVMCAYATGSCLMKEAECQETRLTDCFNTCTRRHHGRHHPTLSTLHHWSADLLNWCEIVYTY